MARVFLYQYSGTKGPQTVVVDDPDERVPILEKGEIVVRNGNIWRVDSVTFTQCFEPWRSPLEVRITLVSLHSQK